MSLAETVQVLTARHQEAKRRDAEGACERRRAEVLAEYLDARAAVDALACRHRERCGCAAHRALHAALVRYRLDFAPPEAA